MTDPETMAPPGKGYDEPYRYSREEREASFESEDQAYRTQWRGWIILGVMILVSVGYHGVIFLLQPGLR